MNAERHESEHGGASACNIGAALTGALAAIAVAGAVAGGGCRKSPAGEGEPGAAPAPAAAVPDHISLAVAHGPRWLGTYTSSWRGFRTNSYWIEGPDGLVLVDTQFLPSDGVEAVELAESLTGKKVVAAFVLHPNPDKFNGTAALQARGIRVLTSDQVLARVPAVHELRKRWFYDRYKPDYPADTPAPESFGKDTREIELAGLTLKLHVMGPGCSDAHVVLEHRGHVFVGDLVTNLGHAWLELGMLDEWLARLDEIAALEPEQIHPGRGASGGPSLLVQQRGYLSRVLDRVRREQAAAGAAPADLDAALARVATQLGEDYPGYAFSRFVEIGLPAVWSQVARSSTQPRE